MIKIYFTENNTEWSSDKLDEMLLPLAAEMRTKILAYKGWRERQSRILGKWQLLKLLEYFELKFSLADLKYTEFNKPYFTNDFDFSIAHSGDMVICGGTMNSQIGVDIELIAPLTLEDYQEQLTIQEWEYIQDAANRLDPFYHIWTRKEALLKALGRGVDMDFDTMDVRGDKVSYDGVDHWFYPLPIAKGYAACIASSAPMDSEEVSFEKLTDL